MAQINAFFNMLHEYGGSDLHLASGVRNVWDVAEGWRLSTTAERLAILAGTGQQAAGQFEVSDKVAERLYSLRGQDLLLVVSQQPRAAGQPQAALVAAVPLTEALGALQRTFGDLCDLVEDEPAPAPVTAQAKEPAALAATIENPGKAVASDIKGKGKG